MIIAVVLGQDVFDAVEGEFSPGNAVGVASHNAAKVGTFFNILCQVVEPQRNFAQIVGSVRGQN